LLQRDGCGHAAASPGTDRDEKEGVLQRAGRSERGHHTINHFNEVLQSNPLFISSNQRVPPEKMAIED